MSSTSAPIAGASFNYNYDLWWSTSDEKGERRGRLPAARVEEVVTRVWWTPIRKRVSGGPWPYGLHHAFRREATICQRSIGQLGSAVEGELPLHAHTQPAAAFPLFQPSAATGLTDKIAQGVADYLDARPTTT